MAEDLRVVRPFDGIADMDGEVEIWPGSGPRMSLSSGESAIVDVMDAAYSETFCPAALTITNYRLKLYEPTVMGATLAVTLCGGIGLKVADRNGSSDPYALLSLDGPPHRSQLYAKESSVQSQTVDPVWNETFVFEGVQVDHTLIVELLDRDKGTKDDPLGYVDVPCVIQQHWADSIDATNPSRSLEKQWSQSFPVMEGHKHGQGTIRLRFRCVLDQPDSDLVSRHCSIPLLSIEEAKLEGRTLHILTKTGRQIKLVFDEQEVARQVTKTVMSNPATQSDVFCLRAQPTVSGERIEFSWTAMLSRLTKYSPEGYEKRWRVESELNKGYELCDTYPTEFIVPTDLLDTELQTSAKFRKKNRFTLVSWLHPQNGATLVRCSQPCVGLSSKEGDGACLKRFTSIVGGQLLVCDCRSWTSATANKFKGGGTESDMKMDGFHHEFLDIGNIHDMRAAFHSLRSGVCQQKNFCACAKSVADWCGHIHAVLQGAIYVAECLEGGISAIVHCSDGWDRTSQICSLASLLLDRYYRTIVGFVELVEKDWLQTGYKFRDRCGWPMSQEENPSSKREEEVSPIFIQFLDCILQLWTVNPARFEYTPDFLVFVLYHTYSGMYDTFLGNCCKDRDDFAGSHSCFWSEILDQQHRWRNPQYQESGNFHLPLVPFTLSPHRIMYSEVLYASQCRLWDVEQHIGRIRPKLSEVADFGREVPHRYVKRAAASSALAIPDSRRLLKPKIVTKCSLYGCPLDALPPKLKEADWILTQFLHLPYEFPARPHVEVTSHLTKGDYTAYMIATTSTDKGRVWQTSHRYNEFDALKCALEKTHLKLKHPFPSKHRFRGCLSEQSKDTRQKELNDWLNDVVNVLVEAEEAAKSVPEVSSSRRLRSW